MDSCERGRWRLCLEIIIYSVCLSLSLSQTRICFRQFFFVSSLVSGMPVVRWDTNRDTQNTHKRELAHSLLCECSASDVWCDRFHLFQDVEGRRRRRSECLSLFSSYSLVFASKLAGEQAVIVSSVWCACHWFESCSRMRTKRTKSPVNHPKWYRKIDPAMQHIHSQSAEWTWISSKHWCMMQRADNRDMVFVPRNH